MEEEVKLQIQRWMRLKRKEKCKGLKITTRGNIAPDLRDAYSDGMNDVFEVAQLYGRFVELCALAREYQWAEKARDEMGLEIQKITNPLLEANPVPGLSTTSQPSMSAPA